jgi:hypothetical protein
MAVGEGSGILMDIWFLYHQGISHCLLHRQENAESNIPCAWFRKENVDLKFVWVKCEPDSGDIAPAIQNLPFFLQEVAPAPPRSGKLDSALEDLAATCPAVAARKEYYGKLSCSTIGPL